MAGDPLFSHIESMQGDVPWGRVLDAGTGWHSLKWMQQLTSEHWTAVTIDPTRIATMMPTFQKKMRPNDRIILGDWEDPALLEGEQFDVVLMDYLVGAMDAFTPYAQDRIVQRIRKHVHHRLYLIGLEPLPESDPDPAVQAMIELDRLKDACRLLAGKRPYREYPASWIARRCAEAGLVILNVQHFPRILREKFVRSRIAACRKLVPSMQSLALQSGMNEHITQLEQRLLAFAARPEGIRISTNYVLSARAEHSNS